MKQGPTKCGQKHWWTYQQHCGNVGTTVAGGRTGGITGILGAEPRLTSGPPPPPPARATNPKDWRTTGPRTGGDQPPNWTGTSLLFNLDRSIVCFRLGVVGRWRLTWDFLKYLPPRAAFCCALVPRWGICVCGFCWCRPPGVGTDHSGVVLRGLCFPSLLCGYAGPVEQMYISVKLPVPTAFFVLRTHVLWICLGTVSS